MDLAKRMMPGLLYGERHGYGAPFTGSGSEAAASRLTREDLVRFHAQWSAPNNAMLVVVSDINLGEIMPDLEAAFGGWKPGAPAVKNIRP